MKKTVSLCVMFLSFFLLSAADSSPSIKQSRFKKIFENFNFNVKSGKSSISSLPVAPGNNPLSSASESAPRNCELIIQSNPLQCRISIPALKINLLKKKDRWKITDIAPGKHEMFFSALGKRISSSFSIKDWHLTYLFVDFSNMKITAKTYLLGNKIHDSVWIYIRCASQNSPWGIWYKRGLNETQFPFPSSIRLDEFIVSITEPRQPVKKIKQFDFSISSIDKKFSEHVCLMAKRNPSGSYALKPDNFERILYHNKTLWLNVLDQSPATEGICSAGIVLMIREKNPYRKSGS